MQSKEEKMKELKAHLATLNKRLKNLNKSIKVLQSANGERNIHISGIGAIKKQVGFTVSRIKATEIDIENLKKGIEKESIQLYVDKDLPL